MVPQRDSMNAEPMRARQFAAACFAATLAVVLWRFSSSAAGQITRPQPAPPPDETQSLTLVFGAKDTEPSKWDGSISLSAGEILKVAGYHFTDACKVEGSAWVCSTHPWGIFSAGMHPDERPQPQPTAMEPVGITVTFRAPAGAEFRVKVPRGEFSFRPMDVPPAGGIFPLAATVEIYRVPNVEQVTTEQYEDDYPSIAADGNSIWTAWQGYRDGGEHVFVRERGGAPVQLTEKPADAFMTAVAARNGRVTVAWAERENGGWAIRARAVENGRPAAVETPVPANGNNLFHRMTADSAGNLHLVYQSWRQGRSDIYLRSRVNGRWGSEILVSDPRREARANDWNPAVAADRKGTVWVAWDGYAGGSYNIYLRAVRGGKPAELQQATKSTRFHAHASLAVDAQDRIWLAYDEAPENWGKDIGFLLKGGSGLYEARTIKVAVFSTGQWMTPLRQPGDMAPYGFRRYFHTPRLAADASGRMWLLARPRTSARLPTSLWAAGGKWEVVASYYDGDRWSDLMMVPESVGRNEGGVEAAADSAGNVYVALLTDHRLWGGPNFGHPPQNNDVMLARLRAEGRGTLQVAARPPEPPAGLPSEPRENDQIAALRAHTIQAGGKTYRIYRGDMHRHTDISADGAGDGSLWDAYRYTMDAAGMDYFAVTDHQSGNQEYTSWRIQKSADMFQVPGFFTALFGTERSLGYPNGHRNLIFARRGVEILPITPQEQKSSTGPVLYPYLRQNKGIAMSHTSATNMGTDWRDNDPELEPLVEIFQGARTSAEHEGAPLAPVEKRTELHAGGYRPLGFLWNAWSKGYKLGVQASSDHVSTHTSYACLIAENSSREALMDAIRKRHSYAATANILLDYRVQAGGTEYLQGDLVNASAPPEFRARIVGTGPLKQVVLVRDNKYVYTQQASGETFDLRYRDNEDAPGQHYYYVRVEQQDGNVAWSSPVWVKR